MNVKIIVSIVALVLIICSVAVAGVYIVGYFEEEERKEEIEEPEGRFKMDIDGVAGYGFAGITGWSLSEADYRIEQMIEQDAAGLTVLNPLWWWDSGNVKVKAQLISPTGLTYNSPELDLGSFNVWTGDSKTWALHIDMIVPNTSPFTLKILLYEEYQQKATQSFSGIVILPANVAE